MTNTDSTWSRKLQRSINISPANLPWIFISTGKIKCSYHCLCSIPFSNNDKLLTTYHCLISSLWMDDFNAYSVLAYLLLLRWAGLTITAATWSLWAATLNVSLTDAPITTLLGILSTCWHVLRPVMLLKNNKYHKNYATGQRIRDWLYITDVSCLIHALLDYKKYT
jgi:hypothetical protein